MTFSYSGQPDSSDKDEVRFWVQDVGMDTEWYLSDEEINYLNSKWLLTSGSPLFVAAIAAEIISSKFTGEVSVSADGVSVSTADLQDKYHRLAASLREQHKALLATATGPHLTAHESVWSTSYDYTLHPLIFGIGFMDNAEVGRQDYGGRHPGSAPGYEERY